MRSGRQKENIVPDIKTPDGRADMAEILSEAMLGPVRAVGEMLAKEIVQLRSEIVQLREELRFLERVVEETS
jgi:hypothetical protein